MILELAARNGHSSAVAARKNVENIFLFQEVLSITTEVTGGVNCIRMHYHY